MRKRIIEPLVEQQAASSKDDWLDLESLAEVEITSEDNGAGFRARLGVARRDTRKANHPAALRPPATTKAHLSQLRRARGSAYTGIRFALVSGRRAVVSGDRTAAMELQPAGRDVREGRPPRRPARRDLTRVEHRPGRERWKRDRFFGAATCRLEARCKTAESSDQSFWTTTRPCAFTKMR
jgi:hypothetical protein